MWVLLFLCGFYCFYVGFIVSMWVLDSTMQADDGEAENQNLYCTATITHTNPTATSQQAALRTTSVQVLNMNWVDTATYPTERVDLLLGSDLVYDASILAVLIPAICSTLSAGIDICSMCVFNVVEVVVVVVFAIVVVIILLL